MKIELCLLALGGVVAQLPPEGPENPDLTQPSGSKADSAASFRALQANLRGRPPGGPRALREPGATLPQATQWLRLGNTNWGSVGGSGSDWDWSWGGDARWDPNKELWHFRPSWNWDSPYPPDGTIYPPDGTMYIENWGNPPTREVPSRRSFYLGAENGVSLAGLQWRVAVPTAVGATGVFT